VAGPLLVSSRIFGLDPDSGRVPPDPAEQVRLLFANVDRVLAAAGGERADVVRMSVTVAHGDHRPLLDDAWTAAFPDPDHRPARHVEVSDALRAPLAVAAEITAFLEGARR